MKRGLEFSTNPLGLPTVSPRDQLRQNIGHHIVGHRIDLQKLEETVRQEQQALASGTTHPKPAEERAHIEQSVVTKAVRTGGNHNGLEDTLSFLQPEINKLQVQRKKLETELGNKYTDKPTAEAELKSVKVQLRTRETNARHLRVDLAKSNLRVHRSQRQGEHIPVADQRAMS